MNFLESLVALLTSGVLFGIFAIFYRLGRNQVGRNQGNMDNHFLSINERFKATNEKIDKLEAKMEARFLGMENRFVNLEKNFQQLDTRVAVIESRLGDLTTNVNHLMWSSQVYPPREAQEQ